MEIKIKMEREITRENLEDIFVTAIEGGSNYWYYFDEYACDIIRVAVPQSVEPAFSMAAFLAVVEHKVKVPVFDVETEEIVGILNVEKFQERFQALFNDERCRTALINMLDGDGDSSDADVVFQYLSMGEVIYG